MATSVNSRSPIPASQEDINGSGSGLPLCLVLLIQKLELGPSVWVIVVRSLYGIAGKGVPPS